MFLPTMTDAEIRLEARKDYFELSTRVYISFDSFCRRYTEIVGGDPYALLNNTVEIKTYRTRKHNTWTSRFSYTNQGGPYSRRYHWHLYSAIRRAIGTEYIFLTSFKTPWVQRFTHHFIERYKERHLAPFNIDPGAMPIPLYFLLHNEHHILGRYHKASELDIAEGKHKKFWIVDEGIYVTDYIDGMLTYITFMDKTDLSPFKQQIYEEEVAWDLVTCVVDKTRAEEDRSKAAWQIMHNPQMCKTIESFLHRNMDKRDGGIEDAIKLLRETWPRLLADMKQVRKECEEKEKEERRKNRIV